MGKEVKTMNYEKPSVALVASAVEAVKSQTTKDVDPFPDNIHMFVTVAAYEADE